MQGTFLKSWVILAAAAAVLAGCDVSTGPVEEVAADPGEDGRTYPLADGTEGPQTDFDTISARDRAKVRTWVPDPSAPAAAVALPCDGAAPKPDGSCCAPGEAWSATTKACAAVSGGTCTSASNCAVPWCFDLLDSSGAACPSEGPNCRVVPRDCKASDTGSDHRCLLGQAVQGSSCVAVASHIEQPFGGSVATDQTLPAQPPELPSDLQPTPLADPPAVTLPQWCASAVGDVIACPFGAAACTVGQIKDKTGTCQPLLSALPAWCPPGFVGSGEPALCTADLADCGSGTWGNLPSGKLVYVDSSAASGGDGTATAPFSELPKGLAAAVTDTTVMVAAGTYTLPPQGLTVPTAVTLHGRCAQLVKLQADAAGNTALKVTGKVEKLAISGGNTPLLVNAGGVAERLLVSGGKVAAVNLNGTLRESLVLPAAHGIEISGGTAVVERVRVDHAVERAFAVYGAAQVQVTDLAITSTQAKNGNQGRAVVVAEAAQVSISGLRAQDQSDVAVLSTDPDSKLSVERFWIVGTGAQPSDGTGGQGVAATGGGYAKLSHGRILQATSAGVLVSGAGSGANLGDVTIEQTQAGKDGYGGEGVRVQSAGSVFAEAIVVTSAHSHGVLGTGGGSVMISNALISNTDPRVADGKAGHGIWLEGGAKGTLDLVRLTANRSAGLAVAGQGTTVSGGEVLIESTQPQSIDGKLGFGLMVVEGASAQLSQLQATKNRSVGLLVADPGSTCNVANLRVDNTLPRQNDGSGGIGASVEGGGSLTASKVRLAKNRTFGLQIDGDGSSAQLGGNSGWVIVDGMQVGSSSLKGGWGISVSGGAALKLSHAYLVGAREVGLAASSTGTTLDASDVFVADSLAGPKGEMGRGLVVEAGAVAKVSKLVATAQRQAGVSVHSAKLDLSDAWVGGTLPDESITSTAGKGQYGRGITVAGNAKVSLLRVRLTGNREAALSAYNQSTVLADHLTVDATQPQPQKSEGGRAIDVSHQATLDVQHALLRGHVEVAAAVSGLGATLKLADVAVQTVTADADAHAGMALAAQLKGALTVAGATLTGLQTAGVTAVDAKLALYGVAVDAVTLNAAGEKGFGIMGYLGASGKLRAVKVTGAHASGLFWREGTLSVDQCGVFGTAPASFAWGKYTVAAADGATLVNSQVSLAHCHFDKNVRAGAVISEGTVSLADVLSSGNGIGWCLQGAGLLLGDTFAALGNTVQVWLGSTLPVPPPAQPVSPRWALYPLTI